MNTLKGRLLYSIDKNKGLLFRQMSFYSVDFKTGTCDFLCRLPVTKKTLLISHSRLLSRLKRLEPKCAGRLSKTKFVVSLSRSIWLIDVKEKTCIKLRETPKGFSEVISFCSTANGVYWGDYGRNTAHNEVNIYHLGLDLQAKIVYTFTARAIRHIHNIVETTDGYLLFAGDNEEKAGIYRVNQDWTEIKPWKTGQQKYRAVIGFPYKGGALYATDSVETENFIRLISANGEEKIITAINGSCIYGTDTKDYFLFSTTVEPHEGGGIKNLFSNSLGNGIKSKDVHIIAVNKDNLSVRIVKKYKKDIWPMKLFQYGRVIFAGGQENYEKYVWCSPVACKKYDGKTIKIEL